MFGFGFYIDAAPTALRGQPRAAQVRHLKTDILLSAAGAREMPLTDCLRGQLLPGLSAQFS
jgi:hypothetical protein